MKILWSPLAIEQYFEILLYLKEKWGQVAVTNFVQKVDEKVKALKTNPRICQQFSNSENVRRCVISPQVSMYYEVLGEQLDIRGLYSNAMDSNSLKF